MIGDHSHWLIKEIAEIMSKDGLACFAFDQEGSFLHFINTTYFRQYNNNKKDNNEEEEIIIIKKRAWKE